MIPFIRSLPELMVITQSRDQIYKDIESNDLPETGEESGQRKRYIRSTRDKAIDLPVFPKIDIKKWRKGKEVVSRFFNELDYNNQIQSSYELTLIERQNKIDHYDAA